MALGAVKEFDPEADRIAPYLERVELFLLANQVEVDTRVPAFLSIIGGRAYGVLRDLLAPTLPQETTYELLVEALRAVQGSDSGMLLSQSRRESEWKLQP